MNMNGEDNDNGDDNNGAICKEEKSLNFANQPQLEIDFTQLNKTMNSNNMNFTLNNSNTPTASTWRQ